MIDVSSAKPKMIRWLEAIVESQVDDGIDGDAGNKVVVFLDLVVVEVIRRDGGPSLFVG